MSETALLLSATGQDRPGIVDRLTGFLYEAGCNLEDSRMAVLGGEFAIILLVTGPEDALDRVRAGLEGVGADLALGIQAKTTRVGRAASAPSVLYRIKAVAMDHPGIVHKVSHLLAGRGLNVVRLDTHLSQAPVSGTPIFAMEVDAAVPAGTAIPELRRALDDLAAAENIDLDFGIKT